MEKNYYISGYTGFCPDMAHRIGQNYTESTRDALREQPHLRGRLGAMRWHELQKDGGRIRNGDGFECAYDAIPNYASGYTVGQRNNRQDSLQFLSLLLPQVVTWPVNQGRERTFWSAGEVSEEDMVALVNEKNNSIVDSSSDMEEEQEEAWPSIADAKAATNVLNNFFAT
ncbi:hypothetical protein AVEN_27782-1 [Araneus ventricosus]|uniref:Uncharacterized protein n=1 Tax=Araneus ventricosus TaxID=182803 RepID=A0A4Y2L710_ARAVE|nr:hypothetical protein AVEN_27782-1 [Araneus ventricosus]